MLEDQVAYLLQRYLGNYVRGLNKEALKISVWQGNVELTNMQLKPEALNALKLPIKVKAGFLGSVKLQVPWSRLGQDPVLVHLDRIFLLAEPSTQVEGSSEDAVQEVKRSRIREMERKLLERRQILENEMNKSWLGSLINTVIGNLKLSISNIHIRYEDIESNFGHPFASGVTLDKLLAVTVDDSGQEIFATGGALERIQKSVELERLAVYLDSDISPWHIDKSWEDLTPREWEQVCFVILVNVFFSYALELGVTMFHEIQIFKFGTRNGKPATILDEEHTYVLQPVTGNAKYSKQHLNMTVNTGQPLQKAVVNLEDVTLSLSKSGYRDLLKLADNFSAFNQRLKYAHYRPRVAVKSDPRSWWKYAYRAISDQLKKASGRLSWEQVLRYARLRKKYISLYAKLLRSDVDRTVVDDNEEIKELDRELDIELILQWRMLAHKFVSQTMESDAYLKNQKTKKSWWPFGGSSNPTKDENEPWVLSDDDWERLNNIIGYREGEDEELVANNERADVLHTSLEIHMNHNASRLTYAKGCLADLSCDNLDCFIELYAESKVFDIRLGSYQLSSPNGLLAESATRHDSLVGAFRYKPFDSEVDWSLSAKASPCYMTYLKDSIDEIINFFQSNAAVSRSVALETAAAVQMTIDEVKRTAQQEVNRALKNQARFFLDLDIAAPKITIPTDFSPDNSHSTKLLLDLGNLIIRTRGDDEAVPPEELNMYFQFNLVLSDVSAFLVDGDYYWSQASPEKIDASSKSALINFLPVIDKCGVVVKLQQIRLENPSFPSTRLAVRLPSLGFHFSPARYHRLIQVVKVFQGDSRDTADLPRPWSEADFEGWLSVLTRKGIGGRDAIWQQKYVCIVGPYLYVLDHPNSTSYTQYKSLRGKQLYQVPADTVGDLDYVLALSDSERFNGKLVEDASNLLFHCDSEDALRTWQRWLQGAIYSASGSAPITGLSETSSDTDSENDRLDDEDLIHSSVMEKVFLTGVLDELKICFHYNSKHDQNFVKVLLAEESRLFELRAIGGRVELSIRGNDMFIGTVLKALEVEDLVCCKGKSQPCYLARSIIRSSDAPVLSDNIDDKRLSSGDYSQGEGDDEFYEASETLNEESPQSVGTEQRSHFQSFGLSDNHIKSPSFSRLVGLLPSEHGDSGADNFVPSNQLDSFVKAQIAVYDKNSAVREGIETKVAVTLATLSFFCRRPTILAIITFSNAINMGDDNRNSFSDSSTSTEHDDVTGENVEDKLASVIYKEPVAKGFIGKGKSRIIFYLTLNMARAQIFLMKENGSRLATLSQDNFLTDIKVFPSSFAIKASLGNLRISDDSLHNNHIYFWACDMRDPGGSSFVELIFCSFNPDDEDYDGYDYSLTGQLSEVRIIYLNRFIQEVISYFMGLVPSNEIDVIKVKEQGADTEKSTKNAIDGSPAVRLDVSLRKPIILMPRRTDSLEYLKLDIVQITVQNTFQWFGGSKSETKAVHMDIMMVKVEDINLNVGAGSDLGESIMKDVKGISVIIQRPLRDLLHQVPGSEVTVKIEELKAALSSKEYQIITECAQSNFAETPNLAPQLNDIPLFPSADGSEPSVPVESNAVESEVPIREAWITTKVSLAIDLVELSLYYGVTRDASLATVQVSGVWFLYKSNTLGDGFLSATLKDFTVLDDREGTEKELRLAIRNPATIDYKQKDLLPNEETHFERDSEGENRRGKLVPTMLILDARFNEYSTSLLLRIQRPQLLVALDFLLDVVEFFVPTVRGMLSNEEDKNSSHIVDAIILDQSVYYQPSAEFALSPLRPLVADDERFELFVYDGRGGRLFLQDRQGFNLSVPSLEPMIYVGNGKQLRFQNVIVHDGQFLDSCILLGSNSSYSASKDDGVCIEEGDVGHSQSYSGESSSNLSAKNAAVTRSTEITFELQAIGPELTFYNSSRDAGKSLTLSNKLLHTKLDAFCRLVLKGDTIDMNADILGFTMESNGIRILEPFDASVKYSNASGKTNVNLIVSDIFLNFTFSTLRLFLAVEDDILAFLRTSAKKMTMVCSEFDKIGTLQNPSNDQMCTFWRPRVPPGFAILGDYLTPIDKPPTKGVIAVNTSFVRLKRPESFKLVWPLTSIDHDGHSQGEINGEVSKGEGEGEGEVSIWFPEAPRGYISLGCVVSHGTVQPPVSSAYCILASLVSTCGLRDCVNIHVKNSSLAFWRVDNSLGSFLPSDPSNMDLIGRACELREIVFRFPEISPQTLRISDIETLPLGREHQVQSERSSTVNSGRRFEAVASFRLIWWNQGSGSRKKVSIWRPIVPEGMVYFGDIAVKGYEPPNTCVVLHDSDEELYKLPLDFQLIGRVKKHRGVDAMSFWLPQAPPGFVSLGCVACKGTPKTSDIFSLRCIRSDMVTGDEFTDESLWDTSEMRFVKEPLSIWSVANELGTFIVRSGFKKPPKRFALKLAALDIASGSNDIVIDAQLKTFSAALFDDYSGLMVPLCNLSLSSIRFDLHGRSDFSTSCISFSLIARSYNDKYDSWEPLIEPVDGLLRYQYNPNAPGAASQLRLTSSGILNLNVSVSNANMIFQAYASWNSLSRVHESSTNQESNSPTGRRDIIDMHHRKNYHLIPENKLGRDIFIKVTENLSVSNIIKLPPGKTKPLKVPVSQNMLDSHFNGNLSGKMEQMVTFIVAEAEIPKTESLSSCQYGVTVRLTPSQSPSVQSQQNQQSARTSGAGAASSPGVEIVKWNEVFFFKIDSADSYTVDMIVTDIGKGEAVGYFSSPLEEIAKPEDSSTGLVWLQLSSAESDVAASKEIVKLSSARIRCSVLLSPKPEVDGERSLIGERKSGSFQISPTREGPWTTVRLNYAAPAACWQFGSKLVASEVSVHDTDRYVTIRSLVSVHNDTDIPLELCLKLSSSSQNSASFDDRGMEATKESNQFVTDEVFQNEKYDPTVGWVELDSIEGALSDELPSGWEWIDEWHVDKGSVSTADGWVYAPDFAHLKWPESYNPLKNVNYARQRRWIRHRKLISQDIISQISVGILKPGEILPLPLSGLTSSVSYALQLRPLDLEKSREYCWSSVINRPYPAKDLGKIKENSEICVSTLERTEELLYCPEMSGTSSNGSQSMWFCVNIQAKEIAKDVYSEPINDWSLAVKPPLSITNFLPLSAEFSVLEMQSNGHFLDCFRGVFSPGETINIYNVDVRNPLYLSLLPQKGWLPLHEAVLISHPSRAPSKTISLRSSISGRIVQLILDQTEHHEGLGQSRILRVYSPYWLGIARCPPLTLRLVDSSARRTKRKLSLPFKSKKTGDVILEEITEEELADGYTIASALNFKFLGLSASLSQSGEHFGLVKDLSPLSEMDGSVDLSAYDSDGNCMRLFISSKPCAFQSVPTKVISVRPYVTFTNRLGEKIYMKLSNEDEPKILQPADSRVPFVYRETDGPMKLQVRLEGTNWTFPFQLVKEDTISLVTRKDDGTRRFLRIEIRGYEEGSRFIVVFRCGSLNGPIRFENRTRKMQMKIRQCGFGDDAQLHLYPLSTNNFCWEDPYGQKLIDVEIYDSNSSTICNFNLDNPGLLSEGESLGLLLHVLDLGDIKVARFLETTPLASPRNGHKSMIPARSFQSSLIDTKTQENGSPLELIVELGACGVSIVDQRPKELSYLYLERVYISYSTGYDSGTTSRFKLILGYLQVDNQLPLTVMPVLLAPEQMSDINHPVFKMTLTVSNKSLDGIQIYPYVYIRVIDQSWRLNIHEPIIWALIDFYNYLRLDRVNQSSSTTQVDPEIRVDLIDISEIRLKVSLETSPAQRPQGVLGVWSPILSAVGNAFKIQIHLRKVIRRDRFMRKSSVASAIGNRLWRDLVHNPLHLIFSVDVLGMTSSTLSSLSKGFAELSTDGQFLQLRSKQGWSRRIGGVGDGIIQGTEALAQGVAFGVSGVLTKPVESARQNGLIGLAHGLGRAFLGFIVQPVSGALDFVSLTVDGVGASCSRCLDIIHNKTQLQRIRNPRAIRGDNILREYNEREAIGQMILFLAEASRRFGCTEIFKEPSKFAWSDQYEDHFIVPYQRIVLVTNKRVMLLQCVAPDKMDKKPCKIMWDVPWEDILALELAKAGFPIATHLIIHLKRFRRSENFVRVIKCNTEELNDGEPQAVKICSVVRKFWRAHNSGIKSRMPKVSANHRLVRFSHSATGSRPHPQSKFIIKSREIALSGSVADKRFVTHCMNFSKVWSSEQESKGRCNLCQKQASEDGGICSIWRPICPDGYISIGDIARSGNHPPNVAAVYCYSDKLFTLPVGFDLVWRNCPDDYVTPVSIWHPRAPEGYVFPGCVAVPSFEEPEPNAVYCIAESLVEETGFEEQKIWSAPDSYPWACHIYQVQSEALHFVALRQPREESDWKPNRVVDEPQQSAQISEVQWHL
ncbi:OLC1v1031527C1 [Oldenlandia corymbosa var. corymbosa]|uniref:OLC1v1031527C1 n=1 Tax=Oldenlandia corymbosa var. corymbosa TaxID=529605 RepID=A0AAV1CLJ7_OLDCO|nr:OLC1v1031527C1 [Oldenlandia corymbosa var. corymbosa]